MYGSPVIRRGLRRVNWVQIMKNHFTIRRHGPAPLTVRLLMQQTRLASLIRLVAQNLDRAAFGELFDELAPKVKALLMRRGMDSAGAEDVMQDVMINIWTKAGLFDVERGSVMAWVYTIARNAMIDRVRKQKPNLSIDMIEWDPVDETEGVEERMLRDERTVSLQGALKKIPVDQLEILNLAYREELSQTEIAEKLGLPLGTVKSRMRLAYARLRNTLEERT
jgi:RNA polymerase sigma-70 factor, ECF subfamily